MARSTLLLGLSLIVAASVAAGGLRSVTPSGQARDGPPTPPADHHMHVRSPAAVEAFRQAQDALEQVVIPEERLVPLDGSDAVAALDSAGIEKGVLLSVAYLFATPELQLQDEYGKVRAENDFVAAQVRRRPDRLVGFFSVDPLADYAVREIERCAAIEGLTGLKLHFGNSDVDLRDPEHVDRLRAVFARADELGLPIVVHLRTRSAEFGARDAEVFLERVLAAAPDVPVQVAHLAGPGGYDDAQRQALSVLISAMEDRPDLTEHLFFDLAAVPQPPALAEGDTSLLRRVEEMNAVVADALLEVGLDRVVYGTDWDAVPLPFYLDQIREALPMTEAEIRDLLDDPAPYLEPSGG